MYLRVSMASISDSSLKTFLMSENQAPTYNREDPASLSFFLQVAILLRRLPSCWWPTPCLPLLPLPPFTWLAIGSVARFAFLGYVWFMRFAFDCLNWCLRWRRSSPHVVTTSIKDKRRAVQKACLRGAVGVEGAQTLYTRTGNEQLRCPHFRYIYCGNTMTASPTARRLCTIRLTLFCTLRTTSMPSGSRRSVPGKALFKACWCTESVPTGRRATWQLPRVGSVFCACQPVCRGRSVNAAIKAHQPLLRRFLPD